MPADKTPNILYKYYSPDRWNDSFMKRMIRFSPCTELNDPFEGMPAFQKVHSLASRKELMQTNSGMTDDFFRKLENNESLEILRSRLKKSHKFGVFCLTPMPRNMLMWAHYADSHKGFVVGFNMRSRFFNCENYSDQWSPKKVEYLKSRRKIKNLSDITRDEFEAMIYTKGKCWEYEQEYRMLCPLKKCSSVWDGDKELKGFHTIPSSAITCVILGASMNAASVEKCCEDLSGAECSHIRIQKTQLHQSGYSLVFKNL